MSEIEASSSNRLLKSKAKYHPSLLELYKKASFNDILLLLLAITLTILLSGLFIVLILQLGESMKTIHDEQDDRDEFFNKQQRISTYMLCIALVSVALGWSAVICFMKLSFILSLNYKKSYFSTIINKPIKWYDKQNPAELSTAINKDCEQIEQAIGEKFLLAFSSMLVFFMSWITAFIVNFNVALIAFACMPVQLFAGFLIQRSTQMEVEMHHEKYVTSAGIAEECLEGVKTIAACNAQKVKAKRFQMEFKPLRKSRAKLSGMLGLGTGLLFASMFSITGIIYYYGAYLMVNEPEVLGIQLSADAADSVIVFFLTALISTRVGATIPCVVAFEVGRQSAGKVNNLLLQNKKYDGYKKAYYPKGSIEFKQVCFRYPSSQHLNVIQSLSFKVNPGKSLALVGETGCGKSTIIQLISGFYYADSGSIKIDNVNIKKYNIKSLRKFISLVSQEPMVFNCSIKENIRMGRLNATDREIEEAAMQAEAKEFISKLPKSFDTLVGVKGCQISGGQKQRIAIARALLKDPRILLLDEATSALDMKTEKRIQMTLNSVMTNRTTIISAQRLSTIKNCDSIAVVSQGQITESGTFQELISLNGAFSRILGGEQKLNPSEILLTEDHETYIPTDHSFHAPNKTSRKLPIRILPRVFKVLLSYWIWFAVSIIFSIITGASFPFFGYYFAESTKSLLTSDDPISECQENMYILFIISAIVLISLFLACISLSQISFLYSYKLRYQTMSSLLYYDQDFFDTPGNTPASLTGKLTSSCDAVSKIGGLIFILQAISVTSIVVGVVISMMYSVLMSLFAICLLPFMIYVMIKQRGIDKEGIAPKDLRLTAEVVSESLTNIRTVQSFNLQDEFYEKYVSACTKENLAVKENVDFNGFIFGIRYSFMYSIRACLVLFGAFLVKEHDISQREYLIEIYVLNFSIWCFTLVAFFSVDITGGIQSAVDIFEIIDHEPEINAKLKSGVKSVITGKVEFKNVSFTYKTRDIKVLDQLSFKVDAGQRLGITGTTGSGKSTIAQLLLRFYNPSDGEILIDDVRIDDYNLKYLRNCIGWVGQEPILFTGSILENVKLGNKNISTDQAIEALQEAQAWDIVQKYGIDSDVGLKGNKLSGGQKQRIAIARALARLPSVLIFDESTSALDNITEKLLHESIKVKQCTIIAISHKLQTIENFDNILVIESGKIIEHGSHSELMRIENGVYRELITSK